ncbi:hypothetical protein HDU87_000017 [Geranomyces variabilis]|uniref:Uncharacterized protein n=1 Tax=Geranomyces variabilis TaxID=109894 RepID=A0AAD5XRD7_9FUNG|nr:hypothetical protein HDU87_000017 [Geranomyces variabilis]
MGSRRLPAAVPLLIALSLVIHLSPHTHLVHFAQGGLLGFGLLETFRRATADRAVAALAADNSRLKEDARLHLQQLQLLREQLDAKVAAPPTPAPAAAAASAPASPSLPPDIPTPAAAIAIAHTRTPSGSIVSLPPCAQDANQSSENARRFLSTISHEIRTPLSGIVGIGALLADTPLNTDQADLLKSLRECSEGLLLIVNDVLDYSKIDAGKLDLELRPFDLMACVDSACHLLDMNASPKGIQLTQTVAEGTPKYVIGDANRLRQVLINLVSNAVKFTARGSVCVRVSGVDEFDSTGSLSSVRVLFEVEDSGIGIPASSMEKLFESFSQLHQDAGARRYGGTGLGLAISKRLVELMDERGGRMWATSEYGKGSTFYVSLSMPVCTQEDMLNATAGMKQNEAYSWIENDEQSDKDAQTLPIAPAADESATTTLAERVPIKILVAEDNPVNQKLSLRLLQKLGYTSSSVDLVEDGTDAVSAMSAKQYDLILMDVQMPVMSGIEATRRIRMDPTVAQRGLQPVILALTANAMETDRTSCLEAGMNGHISKPVKLETLARMIETHGGARVKTKLSNSSRSPSIASAMSSTLDSQIPTVMVNQPNSPPQSAPTRARNADGSASDEARSGSGTGGSDSSTLGAGLQRDSRSLKRMQPRTQAQLRTRSTSATRFTQTDFLDEDVAKRTISLPGSPSPAPPRLPASAVRSAPSPLTVPPDKASNAS